MSEVECEIPANCDNDQSSFKAYLSRWLAVTAQLAPFTASEIAPKLQQSSTGAAAQCNGGTNGRMCGRRWYTTTNDGSSGVGQQVSFSPVPIIQDQCSLSNLHLDVRPFSHRNKLDDRINGTTLC